MRVEILVFDGFDDIDVFGPLEVSHAAGFDAALVTVDGAGQVTSSSGAVVVPAGSLGAAPDLLVVPGGGWGARAEAGAWGELHRGVLPAAIAARAAAGSVVAGVCTGAMLMAGAGILRGRPAVTHHVAHDDLEATGAVVLRDARVVDDGEVLTSGGVTSGIDLALWLVERELGADAAGAQERRLEYRRQGRVWNGGAWHAGAAGPAAPAGWPCGT